MHNKQKSNSKIGSILVIGDAIIFHRFIDHGTNSTCLNPAVKWPQGPTPSSRSQVGGPRLTCFGGESTIPPNWFPCTGCVAKTAFQRLTSHTLFFYLPNYWRWKWVSRSLLFSKEGKLLPQVGRPAQELSVSDVTCLVTCDVSFGECTCPRRGGTRSGFNGTAGQHHHVMIDPLFCFASTAA